MDSNCSYKYLPLREPKGKGVYAVAEAGGFGAVGEDVAKVGFAFFATDFGTDYFARMIFRLVDRSVINGLIKAWPTGARIKFCFRIKKFLIAVNTMIYTIFMMVIIFPRKRRLSALLKTYMVLVRSKSISNFCITHTLNLKLSFNVKTSIVSPSFTSLASNFSAIRFCNCC